MKIEFKDFSNIHRSFLTKIKTNLWNYSFKGGDIIKFTEPQTYHEPSILYTTGDPNAAKYQEERKAREIEGQKKLDAQIEEKNKELQSEIDKNISLLKTLSENYNLTFDENTKLNKEVKLLEKENM